MIRLDKYLADMGQGTRQEVKKYIRQGRVRVDGETVRRAEYKVDETKQSVSLDDREVGYCRFEYYMLHKPSGVVSATRDSCKTVLELVAPKRKDLFPVGRLDKDTEGLLLITNDGALAHRLLSPGRHVDKRYYARISGIVTEKDKEYFSEGVEIGTGEQKERTGPGRLEIISTDEEKNTSEIYLTIQEGKYHQVKRMFQAVGKEVVYLRRESMGALCLDRDLRPGEYRELTKEELKSL